MAWSLPKALTAQPASPPSQLERKVRCHWVAGEDDAFQPQQRTRGLQGSSRSNSCGENPTMAVDHYENFPVASVLCPPRLRPAVAAIYHFARTADDIADEGSADTAERLSDLAAFRADLLAVFAGGKPSARWPTVFGALDASRRSHNLPMQPLADLLDAFAQDTHNPVYANRTELLDYCSRSANPVGRLLLHLYGISDPALLKQSDAICTALQLINFWQDLSVDVPRGRFYVPTGDLQRHGLEHQDLRHSGCDQRARGLVRELCGWAEGLMLAGAPLALAMPGRGGWELRLVVQGGLRILAKIAAMEYRSFSLRPRLRATDLPIMAWHALRMQGSLPSLAA